MKPHKHAEVIKAWADGAEIQSRNSGSHGWADIKDWAPRWDDNVQYRVKPPKKELWARPYANKDICAAIHWAQQKEMLDLCPSGIWIGPAVKVWEESE